MIWVVRVVFALLLVLFAAVGLAGLIMPEKLMASLHLAATKPAGVAELRGLYGGALTSWALAGIAAWRWPRLRPGLLVGLAISLGAIALARVVSIAVDGEVAFNLPALIGEGVFALCAWALWRKEPQAAAAG
jgi:hypothetical protein